MALICFLYQLERTPFLAWIHSSPSTTFKPSFISTLFLSPPSALSLLLRTLASHILALLFLSLGFRCSPNGVWWWTQESEARGCLERQWRLQEIQASTSGCQFGESCHFLHYVPGGIKAVSQMLGNNPALPAAARNSVVPPSFPDGSSPPAVKTRLCSKFSTPEGCKFGDKCHFAHGEWELGKRTGPAYEDPRSMGPMPGRMAGRLEPPSPGFGAAASFGASATAKISIDASLAGAIIGKNGVNSKHICRVTGAKLSIRENESDPSSRNIELEGTFDQIKQASAMVHELIINVGSASGSSMKNTSKSGSGSGNNFKTKLCENFSKGSCTFGERCHFAHGTEELRKPGM